VPLVPNLYECAPQHTCEFQSSPAHSWNERWSPKPMNYEFTPQPQRFHFQPLESKVYERKESYSRGSKNILHSRYQNTFMNDKLWSKSGPWNVTDPELRREWLVPEPLRHYVVHDKSNHTWFVCDRQTDLAVEGTRAPTRTECIRHFYSLLGRPVPIGHSLISTPGNPAYHGETG
jgi:hypothetical protein